MKKRWFCLLVLLRALPLLAGGNWNYAALAGGEAWLHGQQGGHGVFLLRADRTGGYRDGHLGAEFNTDTFRLTFDRLRFWHGRLELGLRTAGEAYYAGLLPDYYRAGTIDRGRGFWASYLLAEAGAKLKLPGQGSLELSTGARRWRFGAGRDTSPALALPADPWTWETRLRYTFWRLRDEVSLHQGQRLFPRVRGVALGLELGLDLRSAAAPWGARQGTAFDPVDERNDPAQAILLVRQWLRAGRQLRPRLRVQLGEWASWGRGEDDLTRVRLGGLNPYVVPLAGAPWAAYLASHLAAVSLSGQARVWREVEAGMFFDGAVLEDAQRTGHSGQGTLAGAGLLADGRLGRAQLDLRAGWSPGWHWRSGGGNFAFLLACGYTWQ